MNIFLRFNPKDVYKSSIIDFTDLESSQMVTEDFIQLSRENILLFDDGSYSFVSFDKPENLVFSDVF